MNSFTLCKSLVICCTLHSLIRFKASLLSLQIRSESEGDSAGSNSAHSFTRFTPEDARAKIREISRDLEQKKRRAEGRDGVETDESVTKAGEQDFANGDRDIPRPDNGEQMNEMEISSEFSFTSGYRSSEFLSDQSSEELEEDLGEEQGEIISYDEEIKEDVLDDVLSNDEKRAVEVSLEQKHKRSILKARKMKSSGLSLTSPALEDLPDLESVGTQITTNNRASRKVIFLDEKGKILATSGAEEDNSMAVIRKIPKDFDPDESLMKKLKVLSDGGQTGDQPSHLTFLDVTGRVLATSKVSPGTAPTRKVSSSILASALAQPSLDQQEVEPEMSPHLTAAWLQLRKISRNLEGKTD